MTIVVASTVYNLAGDPTKRTDYLKSLLFGAISRGNDIAETIQGGYLTGPGIRLRSFNNWAWTTNEFVLNPTGNHYTDLIQFADGQVYDGLNPSGGVLTAATVQTQIPAIAGSTIVCTGFVYSNINLSAAAQYFGQQWIQLNRTDFATVLTTQWYCVYDWTNHYFTIHYADGTTQNFGPTPTQGNNMLGNVEATNADFLVATYTVTPGISVGGGAAPSSSSELWIYQFGHGSSVLDQYLPTATGTGNVYSYFPFIPVRAGKEFYSPTFGGNPQGSIYAAAKEAYQRAFNNPVSDYDDLITNLGKNTSLNNIDYAYVMFGVTIDVTDNTCRKYIYKYFQQLMAIQPTSGAVRWGSTQGIEQDVVSPSMTILWDSIVEDTGTGLFVAADGHTVTADSAWFELTGGLIRLVWQQTATSWRRLSFTNLVHQNWVYGFSAVTSNASDAVNGADQSGFVVPLDASIFDGLSIVDSTQMGSACALLVLNSYKNVQQPWYASGFFQVVMFVAAVVISVFTFGLGGVGLLGANAVVGASVGLTGTAALLAGAAINALAAVLLTNVITDVSVGLFGKEIGHLIGIFVSFAVISTATMMNSGQSFTLDWSTLSRADTLLQLTNVVGQATQSWIKDQIQGDQQQINQVQSQYKADTQEISALYAQNIGYGTGIDYSLGGAPQMNGDAPFIESPDAFFTRTLMTGTDIAQLTQDMISKFPDLTLNTSLPLMLT